MSSTTKRSIWRRCCPNGCCGFCKAPLQSQKQADTLIHLKSIVTKTETRYGYIKFYPGVRTADNSYTCPVLSVHLYTHSQFQVGGAQDNRTITVDGKNQGRLYQGVQKLVSTEKASAEEEVLTIPLEDILSICYTAGFTKGVDKDVQAHIDPTYVLSENGCDRCWASITKNCRKPIKLTDVWNKTVITAADPDGQINYFEEDLPLPVENGKCFSNCCDRFRCWCCRKKTLVKLTKKTKVVQNQEAQRVITMTIDYSKYSNPDSASNARLLTMQAQTDHFKTIFQPNTPLKFNLDHSAEFDSTNFKEKRQQAETLCRIVMQLKALKNRYPSEEELERILDQHYKRIFGAVFQEPVFQISSGATLAASMASMHMRAGSSSIEVGTIGKEWPITSF